MEPKPRVAKKAWEVQDGALLHLFSLRHIVNSPFYDSPAHNLRASETSKAIGLRDPRKGIVTGIEPFGSRPEPGAHSLNSAYVLPHGEVPEGRARGVQDTATQVPSESELRGPEREPGVQNMLLLQAALSFEGILFSFAMYNVIHYNAT